MWIELWQLSGALWIALTLGIVLGFILAAMCRAAEDDPSTDAWEREAGLTGDRPALHFEPLTPAQQAACVTAFKSAPVSDSGALSLKAFESEQS